MQSLESGGRFSGRLSLRHSNPRRLGNALSKEDVTKSPKIIQEPRAPAYVKLESLQLIQDQQQCFKTPLGLLVTRKLNVGLHITAGLGYRLFEKFHKLPSALDCVEGRRWIHHRHLPLAY
ncbi:MAG TPA: hypothetical protein VE621_01590 [Bryobacteraceae bacterium]|nr:hypothetical protein [Bryobacteraceae bacterium]